MSSFREQAKAMSDAYEQVQQNQQEIDEGLGSLIRGGAKILSRAAKPVAKVAKKAVKNTGKVVKKNPVKTAAVGGALAYDAVGHGGKFTKSAVRMVGDAGKAVHGALKSVPEYGGDKKKDKPEDKTQPSSSTPDKTKTEPSPTPDKTKTKPSSSSSSSGGKKLSPMQQWAKAHPGLAKKVKPGQAGYKEIQSMKEEQIEPTQDQRLTSDLMKSLGDAYSSMYDQEELQENQANRERQRRLRQQQRDSKKTQEPGVDAEPRRMTWADRRAARRSSTPAARANTNSAGQAIKVGSPTGPARNNELKSKPSPSPSPSPAPSSRPSPVPSPSPAPSSSPAPSKPANPGFERRTPTMKELRAAQTARAAGKSESDVVKAGVAAGKPAPKPAAPSTPAPSVAPTKPAAASAPKPMSRIAKATSNVKPMRRPMARPASITASRMRSEHLEDLMNYLINEGYANNTESAQVMAQHMSDEWIESISE